MAGLTAAELEAVIGLDDNPLSKGLDAALGMFDGWGGKVGAALAGVGAIGGGLFATGLSGALSLDEAKGKLQAELGLTAQESDRYGGIAGHLFSQAYGDSLGEVTDAVGVVVSSIKGMRQASDAEVQGMTAKVLNFAKTFDVDVSRAAEVAGVAIKSGLVKDGTEAFDLLTATMQKVPKQVREDVLDATEEYSQFFNSLGIKGPQAFAMLAAGAAKGMYGIDKTGDAVKEFTIRATDMSKTTKHAYRSLGLDAQEMTNKLLAGGDQASGAFHKIVQGLLSIKNPAKRSQAALSLFGTPMEDLGTKDIPKFLKSLDGAVPSLGKFQGAADRAGKALNDTAQNNLTSFVRQLKGGLVSVLGGSVVPQLVNLSGILAGSVGPAFHKVGAAVSATTGWLQQHQTVATVLGALIGTVLVAALVAWGAAATVNAAKNVAAWVTTALSAETSGAAQEKTAAMVAAKWLLMGAKAMLGAARVAAAWLISLGPIGIVIAAVAGLVAFIVTHWDQVKRITTQVFGAVWGFLKGIWNKITDFISTAVSKVIGFVKSHWVLIVSIIGGPLAAVVALVVKHWDKIKSFVSGAVDKVLGFVKGAWNSVRSATSAAWDRVVSVVTGGVTKVLGFITALPGRIVNGLADLGEMLWHLFTSAMNRLGDAERAGISKVVDFMRGLPGRILGALSGIGSRMMSIGVNIVQGIWNGITSMAGWLTSKLASFASNLIPGPIKHALGINSPSRVMADEVGRWIPAGIAKGIEGNAGPLDRAVQGMADRVTMTPEQAAYAGAQAGSSLAGGSRRTPEDDETLAALIDEFQALGDRFEKAISNQERDRQLFERTR